MLLRTNTANAPWRVIPANFKWFARVEVAKTILGAVEHAGIKKLS
jgi:polyphosphate kinase 2 (PPK2 family)